MGELYPDEFLDQIELRWRQGQDFGPIAFSGDTGRSPYRSMWEQRLKAIGAVGVADAGQPSFPWSCAYLVYERQAAFLWRTSDKDALSVSTDRGERHTLVARALVGPSEWLTPGLAILLAESGPVPCLRPGPGQVREGAVLDQVPVRRLDADVRSAEAGLDRRAREAPDLERLIAAALTEPDRPHSVMLPGPAFEDGVPAALLWGLWEATGRLLGIEGDGWSWSFSTHEPTSRELFPNSQQPHLVFRSHRVHGPAIDLCEAATPAGTRQARVAEVLTRTYRDRGVSGVDDIFGHVFERETDLDAKLTEIVREHGPGRPGDRAETVVTVRDVVQYGDEPPAEQPPGYQPPVQQVPQSPPAVPAWPEDERLANRLLPAIAEYASRSVVAEAYRKKELAERSRGPYDHHGRGDLGADAFPPPRYDRGVPRVPGRSEPSRPTPARSSEERGKPAAPWWWAPGWMLAAGFVLGVLVEFLANLIL